jgi:hypothetical protein
MELTVRRGLPPVGAAAHGSAVTFATSIRCAAREGSCGAHPGSVADGTGNVLGKGAAGRAFGPAGRR